MKGKSIALFDKYFKFIAFLWGINWIFIIWNKNTCNNKIVSQMCIHVRQNDNLWYNTMYEEIKIVKMCNVPGLSTRANKQCIAVCMGKLNLFSVSNTFKCLLLYWNVVINWIWKKAIGIHIFHKINTFVIYWYSLSDMKIEFGIAI